MLSREELKKIGEASTEEERRLLCDLYGVSLEWFNYIWPAEQLGIEIQDGKAMLVNIEYQYESTGGEGGEEAFSSSHHYSRSHYRQTVHVMFKQFESGHFANTNSMLAPYMAVSKVSTLSIDAKLVPPSLKEAIDRFQQRW